MPTTTTNNAKPTRRFFTGRRRAFQRIANGHRRGARLSGVATLGSAGSWLDP